MVPSTCGGCEKSFSSLSLFASHRVGGYGDTIYNETGTRVVSYTPCTRRCMTTDEMVAAGYQQEIKTIPVYKNGKPLREERVVWFDPVDRAKIRAAFLRQPQEGTWEAQQPECPVRR